MIDQDHSQHRRVAPKGGFWRSRTGIALIVFLAAASFLLVYEHRAHLLTGSWLLVVLLLLCVGMHFFIHGGHGNANERSNWRGRP